jgi:hypothetical protein
MQAAAEVVIKQQAHPQVAVVVQVVAEMAVGLLLRVNLDLEFKPVAQTQVAVVVEAVLMK